MRHPHRNAPAVVVLARVRHSRLGRSAPAELVEPVVVDPEVVRDLVDDGHPDLLDHVGFVVADGEDRAAEHGDPLPARGPVATTADRILDRIGMLDELAERAA